MFVLRRSDYQHLIGRLRTGVSSLESLVSSDVQLEPNRHRRSRDRVCRAVRGAARNVYDAIRDAITCTCPTIHDVGLRLAPQSVSIAGSTTVTRTIATTTTPSGFPSGAIEMQRAPSMAATSHPPASISNLCQALKRSQKQGAGECCGHVKDKNSSRRFDVFPLFDMDNPDTGIWSMVSLGAILDGASDGNQPNTLTYLDRLRLAWTVASSVVQLQSTSWLESPPTHNDIFLIRQSDSTLRKEAFVLKKFSNTTGPITYAATIACAVTPVTAAARNPVLVALGVLLIELILGQPIQKLCPSPGPSRYDLGGLGNDRNLMPILDKVNTVGGSNYHSAVRKCISHDFGFGDIRRGREDEMTRQNAAFFDVIGLLERDMDVVATI